MSSWLGMTPPPMVEWIVGFPGTQPRHAQTPRGRLLLLFPSLQNFPISHFPMSFPNFPAFFPIFPYFTHFPPFFLGDVVGKLIASHVGNFWALSNHSF